MATQFTQRTVPTTSYSERATTFSDVYLLADVSWNLVHDVSWNQVTVKWAAYAQATDYSQRIKP